jgi:DeoR/GlpR family transcriptional regulator of sugar metabolism
MDLNDNTLLAVERQRIIVDILRREGVVRTAELCEMLNVSSVTIRSDLRDLEKAGECEIIWGGAVSKTPPTEAEARLDHRSKINSDSKKRIGARAAEMIENGQTIMLDAGTTTVEVVDHLPRDMEYLRVITPALNVAVATINFPYIELIMPGGVLRNLTRSLIGPQTLQALEGFNADWTFLAASGFDIDHGVTTSNIMEVEVKRTMVKQAARVALVADGSKYGKVLSLNVTPLTRINVLVTDHQLSNPDMQAVEALGVQVIRV